MQRNTLIGLTHFDYFKPTYYSLPTENQWLSCFAKQDSAVFAWPGSYWKNSKGNYLANFAKFSQDNVRYDQSKDSTSFQLNNDNTFSFFVNGPQACDSYHPNDYGIYNVCGNVAEMLKDKDYTKGGSWESPIHYLKKNSTENYTLPSPAVGFRIIKTVIL